VGAGRRPARRGTSGRSPSSGLEPARLLELEAWLASKSGDRRAEQDALEEVIKIDPGATTALERLAELAALEGKRERVTELRRRKAEVDAAKERYRALINLPDLSPQFAELGRAAEAIGRWFDAPAWWRLAARRGAEPAAAAALARLEKLGLRPTGDDRDLASVLAPFVPNTGKTDSAAAALNWPTFRDDAESRGLRFTFDNGRSERRHLPETMSGGVAVLDFDGDGWLDVYVVQGGPFPPIGSPPAFGDRLFHNKGDGQFEDVTAQSGLAQLAGDYGHGVAVGDYDNDGRPDLLITRWRSYALFHNLGKGRFEDVTDRTGLGGQRDWPTSAAWADFDQDGDLDLYVCHYVAYDPGSAPACQFPTSPERTYCDPRTFASLPDHVFRNDGGRFVDVTESAGAVDRQGRGLGVVAADLDDDGQIDLFVANDTTANYFFRNQGKFRFVEQGTVSGLAANESGGYLAGMGVACADFDGDGRLDVAVTNFFGESTTLYHNHGDGIFSDRTAAAGLAAPTRFVLGFGLVALDANNDGRIDLAQANGHVGDYRPSTPYEMPAQLFLGNGSGTFIDASARAGEPWQVRRLARGLAAGDIDNDGRVDLLLVAENQPLVLLHNEGIGAERGADRSHDHFLIIALEGTKSNRDGLGARVALTSAGRTQVAARCGGGSYLSASDHRLHFGLGTVEKVERVDVSWPSGERDTYTDLAVDRGYVLREGATAPQHLKAFDHRSR
jgi:enediyne biosynthesis protein E4